MKAFLLKNAVLLVALLFVLATLLAILAPLFAYLQWQLLSDPIYWFFQWFCHQRPWRSYHLFDFQYALDARMITLFLSFGISGIFVHFTKLPPLKTKPLVLLLLFMLLPMAVDGLTQMAAEISVINNTQNIPFYESTNFVRSLTGVLAGVGLAFALLPNFNNNNNVNFSKIYVRNILFSIIVSTLSIPIMVMLWSVTSENYLPSSFFIDSDQRFPGYNYEITTNAGHSTIERFFQESVDGYIQRAINYQKTEYLSGCERNSTAICTQY